MFHLNESDAAATATAAPFDRDFFQFFLPERVRALAASAPHKVVVVLLHLVDDTVLDLCHLGHLGPRWMEVAAYRDARTCAEMDTLFVPYETVARVTLSPQDPGAQPVGFQTAATADGAPCEH